MASLRRTISFILLALICVIAVGHFAATGTGWYYAEHWIDIPLHVLGGSFVAVLAYYLFAVRFQVFARRSPIPLLPLLALGVGLTAIIGILWEFYEFGIDVLLLNKYGPLETPGYIHFDTLTDLMNDLLGGATTVLLVWFAFEKKFRGAQ